MAGAAIHPAGTAREASANVCRHLHAEGMIHLCRPAAARIGIASFVANCHSRFTIASLTPVQRVARRLQRTCDVHQVAVVRSAGERRRSRGGRTRGRSRASVWDLRLGGL